MMPLLYPAFNGSRVHLGVCGSVAAYKAVELMRLLQAHGVHVSVTLTEAAQRFITPLTFASLGAVSVYGQMFSGRGSSVTESPFDHLEPGTFCDAFAIVPATATTMARVACGSAEDMLSAQALSYTGSLLIAPAMNPRMWANSATRDNVATLVRRGHSVLSPDCGTVACGEGGTGKLPPVTSIAWHILRHVAKQKGFASLEGQKVMLTIGPTREQWDGVRCWTNLSTGRMGSALAVAAWLRGAEVHAVTGPGVPPLPEGIRTYPVVSAAEMFEAAASLWGDMSAGIFTAAVADFSPEPFGAEKFKKTGAQDGFSVRFVPNKDILATLAAGKQPHQRVMAFAAETSNLEEKAREKCQRKNADMLVANIVGREGSGFASQTNEVFVCDKDGNEMHVPCLDKAALAWLLLDKLCEV